MSIDKIINTGLAGLAAADTASKGKIEGDEFRQTLTLQLAHFKSQTVTSLLSGSESGTAGAGFAGITGNAAGNADPLAALQASSTTTATIDTSGRNMALADPEAAYRMMSLINTQEVRYKAEYVEMNAMKSYLHELEQEGLHLSQMTAATPRSEIMGALQHFADAYNGWIERFDAGLQKGGILAGTQAAHVAQWELEKSVEYIFNGAQFGMQGLGSLGLEIDPATRQLKLDEATMERTLDADKTAFVSTVQEFSANFARSAELLVSENNFVRNRMENLEKVLDYVASNRQALESEFGRGDAARPNEQIARALAEYNALQSRPDSG